MKEIKNDYEQLYYDELYKNKKLEEQIKQLQEELEMLKGNKKIIEYIIQEVKKRKE